MSSARLAPLALVAALLAAGCTAFQPERRPEKPLALPSAWQQPQPGTASAAAVFPAKWWSAFGDPRLDALVDQALRVNNDLAAAGIRVQRAQLQAGLADTNLTPGVVGQAATSRGYDLKRGGVAGSSSSSLVTLSYELDLWGRLAAVRSAADWELKATQSDRQATALALVATTANLYWQTGYLNQRIALSEAGMEDARRIVALVRVRYEAGAVSGLDVAQAGQNLDPGDFDLSSLIGGANILLTAPSDSASLELVGGRPVLGSTWDLTTNFIDPVSPIAITFLGAAGPAVPFAAIGINAPGCDINLASTVASLQALAAGGSATVSLPVANNPALAGFQISAQSISLSAINPAGLISSNGVTGTVGN